LVATLALLAFLNLVNPDAWIARVNLDRAARGLGQPLDAAYLTRSLSVDATPVNAAGLAAVSDPKLRTDLACGLVEQAHDLEAIARRLTWRGANLGIASARSALAATAPIPAATICPDQ
jgi:hypothetical protein